MARLPTRISLAKIIAAIEEGSLDVGAKEGVAGFHGIVVRAEQLVPLPTIKERPDPTEGGKLQSAAAFGRSIALRDNGSFAAMIEAGYVSAKARLHPGTKRMQYWMDAADIAAFTARFVTPTMLMADRGYDADWFRKALKDKGIKPCIPGRKSRGKPVKYDKRRYRIEIMFVRLKDWRRVATRYDRCPKVFLSAIALAATVMFWL